ncbi:MAG: hypothetical protein ACRDVL_08630 [Acidimicrobiia bacterium]
MRTTGWMAFGAVAWVLLPAGVASASCMVPPPLEVGLAEADTVFVGTVIDLANQGRTATLEVEEVWKGTVAEEAVVIGGPSGNAFTSVDRTFEEGTRYLVVPARGTGSSFEDNACTLTQPFTPEMAGSRPEESHPPTSELGTEEESAPFPSWAIVAVGLAGAALAAVMVGGKFRSG